MPLPSDDLAAGPVCRRWRGWTTPANAEAYQAYLLDELFPHLRAELTQHGYRCHQLLRHDAAEECEFVALTWFTHLGAVASFAGDDLTLANVSAKARALLARYEPRATHYLAADRASLPSDWSD